MSLLLILFLLFVSTFVGTGFLVFIIGPNMVLKPKKHDDDYFEQKNVPLVPSDLGMNYAELKIKVDKNIFLHGWFIPSNKRAKGFIIYLHGVGSSKIVGLPFVKLMHDKNFNVLMYDSRAHGKSGGKYCTYGFYERHDVTKAIESVESILKKKINKVAVYGMSMGGAIALQAATIEKRIKVLAIEGCFTNLRTITVDYQHRLTRLPWHYLRNIAMKRSEQIARFSHHDVSPLKAVKKIMVPVFFAHGKLDEFSKPQYSQTLFNAANTKKEIHIIENAGHHNLRRIGGKNYADKVEKFFLKNL